jgi:uncharacterized protein YecE (DUF72 family)
VKIRIGTSGYSFQDWVGSFYPEGTVKSDMLTNYVEHFDTVEINSSYYRIPHPRVFENIERKTGDDFEFIVKAYKGMTHERKPTAEMYRDFHSAIDPLVESGKLKGILAQFPWSFKNNEANQSYLSALAESLSPHNLFAEFRHVSWIAEEVFDLLSELGIGYCSVDEPQMSGLVPPIARATTGVGYVRLHGRNYRNWWGRGSGDRYDYNYSRKELSEWAKKILELSSKAKATYVFFNNCHAGQAARNAELMKSILDKEQVELDLD